MITKATGKQGINWMQLFGAVILIEVIGNIGSLATFSQITTWYATLSKPSFNPPSWLFGPVWTILFAMMGVAVYLVWSSRAKPQLRQRALSLFTVQLALNVLWSFVFFGFHQPGLALIEILLLWLAIVGTILGFKSISRTAAWLLVPYLAWVSFATVLTFAIWRLN